MPEAMRQRPDVLIVNSFTPRRRSLSDVFLDNGTGMLRAHLEARGFRVAIEDRSTIPGFAAFSPAWMTGGLRRLAVRLAGLAPERRPSRVESLVFLGLQEALSIVQRRRMRKYVQSIVERVRRERIPVVGVKVWYGEAFTWSKGLVTALRRACPDVITVAGGPHANLYNHEGLILRHSNFDLAIYGEGEHALAGLLSATRIGTDRADRLARIRALDLPNLIWRDDAQLAVNPPEAGDIHTKPIPLYGDSVNLKARVHTIIDALGCDYNKCSFCAHKTIFGDYRRRTASAVVDEMEYMISQGVAIFRFAAGDTPLPHGLAIAREILARGLHVEFSMFHRAVRGVRHRKQRLVEEYRVLMRAGLRAIFMGMETGDDKTNCEMLKKNVVAEDIIGTMDALREARALEGVRCDLSLATIHPVPARDATWDELRERTLAVALAARPDSVLIAPPGVFPGTDWYDHPEEYGFEFDAGYVEELMEYEYVLYKPVELWKVGSYKLGGRGLREIFAETARLRRAFESAGITIDLGDEDFLLLQAADQDPPTYRRESLADIIACSDRYSRGVYERLNAKSRALAASNAERRPDRLAPATATPHRDALDPLERRHPISLG